MGLPYGAGIPQKLEWKMFKDFSEIQVGDSESISKTITESDVRRFVEMTGDDNPLHVDSAYAEST